MARYHSTAKRLLRRLQRMVIASKWSDITTDIVTFLNRIRVRGKDHLRGHSWPNDVTFRDNHVTTEL